MPSRRMVWGAILVVLPAATLAGLAPASAAACAAVVAVWVGVVFVDWVRGAARAKEIEIRTPVYLRMTKDVAAMLPVTIENRSGGAAMLRIGIVVAEGVEAESVKEIEAPGGASAIEWECVGRARGDHTVENVQVEMRSPWGLWLVRGLRRVGLTLRVYPNLRDRATAELFLRNAPGLRLRRVVGKGREFDNLRHYLPGDNFEDIHWKATARRAFPVVKQYRVEHAQEVYAVIDASRLSAREGILESYVNAALHLAIAAERQGDRFGLVTFSDRVHRFMRARSGMEHFRLCRETIYNLKAERVSPDFREVFTSLQVNLRRRSLLVFFTSLDDALLAENFEREVAIIARRHLVLVNVTQTATMTPLFAGRGPESVEEVYEGLAGQMQWNRMRTLQLALAHRGVKLAMVRPEGIKTAVTAQYLDVKRRQAL